MLEPCDKKVKTGDVDRTLMAYPGEAEYWALRDAYEKRSKELHSLEEGFLSGLPIQSSTFKDDRTMLTEAVALLKAEYGKASADLKVVYEAAEDDAIVAFSACTILINGILVYHFSPGNVITPQCAERVASSVAGPTGESVFTASGVVISCTEYTSHCLSDGGIIVCLLYCGTIGPIVRRALKKFHSKVKKLVEKRKYRTKSVNSMVLKYLIVRLKKKTPTEK